MYTYSYIVINMLNKYIYYTVLIKCQWMIQDVPYHIIIAEIYMEGIFKIQKRKSSHHLYFPPVETIFSGPLCNYLGQVRTKFACFDMYWWHPETCLVSVWNAQMRPSSSPCALETKRNSHLLGSTAHSSLSSRSWFAEPAKGSKIYCVKVGLDPTCFFV